MTARQRLELGRQHVLGWRWGPINQKRHDPYTAAESLGDLDAYEIAMGARSIIERSEPSRTDDCQQNTTFTDAASDHLVEIGAGLDGDRIEEDALRAECGD